jgi:hypothetical protein
MEGKHDLRLVRDEADAAPVSHAREARLGLTWLDKLAASAFVEGSPAELADLLELVRGCADSLASEDATDARQRLLAREIAIAKTTLDAMTTAIGHRVRANDASGALLADRLATSAARRLALLVEAHRADTLVEKRCAVVAIGHAEHVTIDAEK